MPRKYHRQGGQPYTESMLRYAITDRSLYGGSSTYRLDSLVDEARRRAAEGVDFIQVREKDLEAGELTALVRRMLEAVREAEGRTRVLVNSRLDVAAAAGADGVHLTGAAGELRPEQVRRVYSGTMVSVSCHSVAEVAQASGWGVEAILFGPVFGKVVDGVEVVPGVGLAGLREACEAAGGGPVLALGGVSLERAPECVAVGAAGVAGIRLFQVRASQG
ncbi:thiamine phosphate synthase [Granulicella sp. dw_53]|uniref:thiamine phosphate synthase n=1 Tax=Granulicella sp. dw_53 TaxID=2719792 RepID=UPI001BD2DF0C|nr:thiamine phosphate synthase [Granulicella sp. dw_53]